MENKKLCVRVELPHTGTCQRVSVRAIVWKHPNYSYQQSSHSTNHPSLITNGYKMHTADRASSNHRQPAIILHLDLQHSPLSPIGGEPF